MPSITIALSSALWPVAADRAEVYAGLELPGLMRLLGGPAKLAAGTDFDHWLCHRCGLEVSGDAPYGALLAAADGLATGRSYWLCATPIHMRLERERIVPLPLPAGQEPDENAAAEIVATLNEHFHPDGLRFHAPHPQRWYVETSTPPALTTTPLVRAIGRHVDPWLPQGADALAWHRYINEIQMLLFSHAVNAQREVARLPAINSVWFWGGGAHPGQGSAKPLAVIADAPSVLAVASAGGATAGATQQCEDQDAAAEAGAADTLFVCREADLPLATGDYRQWQQALRDFDRRVLEPLAGRAKRHKLEIWLGNGDSLFHVDPTPRGWLDRLAFWQRRAGSAEQLTQLATAADQLPPAVVPAPQSR